MSLIPYLPLVQDAVAVAAPAAKGVNLSDLILLVLVGFSFLLVLLAFILWAVVQGYVSGKLKLEAPLASTSANEPNSTH